jgi:hypothetical protein
MLRYKDPNTTPPGGRFPYTESQTGYSFREITLQNLIRVVKNHRLGNSLPIGVNINAEIEDASCRELMEKYPDFNGCVDSAGYSVAKPKGIGITQVMNFLQFLWHVISKGEKPVSQEEATRRAEICAGCPYNIDIGTCITCRMKTLLRATKKGSTPHDGKIKVCGECGCYLPSKIWWSAESMRREGVTYRYEKCWMNEGIDTD